MPADSELLIGEGWDEDDPGYSRRLLRMYDDLVFGFNAPVLWGCPKGRFLDLYEEHVSTNHLDIGVGTGYLLDHCRFSAPDPKITLMDFSPNALNYTAQRLRRYDPAVHRASVTAPWGFPSGVFDSVGMVNLLHCVPGTIREKAVAFEEAHVALAPGGTLFGATVLSHGVKQTWRSRVGIKALNRRGIFANRGDSLDDLEASLDRVFAWHKVTVQGVIALFVARSAPATNG